MVSAWRNFKNIFPRPLFIIIFRPEMLKFHPYSILTGDTRVEFVIYRVLRRFVRSSAFSRLCLSNEAKTWPWWSRIQILIQQRFNEMIFICLGFVNFSSWVHLTKFWLLLTLEILYPVMLKKPYLDNGLRKTTNRNSSGIWILIKFWQDPIHSMFKLYLLMVFYLVFYFENCSCIL